MSPPVIVTAYQGELVGHDTNTGQRVFAHPIGESTALGGMARVVVKAIELLVTDTRIFAVAGGVLHCFEYPTGRPLGAVTLVHDRPGVRPVILHVGARILVGIGSRLHCLDHDGNLLWGSLASKENTLIQTMAIAVPGASRQQDVDST
ncbi:MAG: hypothetical protein JNK05_21695 [Myxococcales bacterium]|nr:hypothetical protein [Myxococcales bacterium]